MLILRTMPGGFGQPSFSPFCVKAMCLLALSGLEWEAEIVPDPRKEPFGKLPVLIDGSGRIADSGAIRTHLEARSGRDFDAQLTPRDRATSHAVIRMVEENLYFFVLRDRWVRPDSWAALKTSNAFGDLPPIVRSIVPGIVRKKLIRDLEGQGAGKFDEETALARAGADLDAISALLGDQAFLFGEAPTAADASVAPILSSPLSSTASSPLGALVRKKGLDHYVARVEAALYPKS